MPSYATPAQFQTRYKTGITDQALQEHYLPHASARLDALLQPYFSVPFASNNQTAVDMTIDLAYLLILQHSKDAKGAAALEKSVLERIQGLINGQQAMIHSDRSAEVAPQRVWSSAERSSFATQPPLFDRPVFSDAVFSDAVFSDAVFNDPSV